MSLSINNNITSLNAWRSVKTTDSKMSSTMEKLSSGLRINRAADDPAGLVISEKMRAQLIGLDTAAKNSEKAINMIQTAEAALDQVQKLLGKMRQLALDSANSGVNDAAMLGANQDELDEAISSVTRIGDYTQFGTKKLLNGNLGSNFTANTAGTIATDIAAASFDGITDTDKAGAVGVAITQAGSKAVLTMALDASSSGQRVHSTNSTLTKDVAFNINGQSFTVASGVSMVDVAKQINGYTDSTGVVASWASATNTLSLTQQDFGSDKYVTFTNTVGTWASAGSTALFSVAASNDYGTDYQATVTYADGSTTSFNEGLGLRMADSGGNTIVLENTTTLATTASSANVGTLTVNNAQFQVGANESQTVTVSISSIKADKLGIGATYTNSSGNQTNVSSNYSSLDKLKSGGATTNGVFVDGDDDAIAQAVGVIDEAISEVSSQRGELGAIQTDNLSAQLDALRISYENLQAAESTIRDTDMTKEMSTFTKYQIMMQAGTAMLAQANQQPNNLLSLLR